MMQQRSMFFWHLSIRGRFADSHWHIKSGGGATPPFSPTSLSSYNWSVLVSCEAIQKRSNEWKIEHVSQDWYSPQEIDDYWEKATEEKHEAICFNNNSNEGKTKDDDEDSSKESKGSSDLVALKKEAERPLEANYKGQSTEEQNIS